MSSLQKRVGLSVTLLVVAIIALAIGLNLNSPTAPSTPAQSTLFFSMTLEPEIVANLTSIPQTTPLSPEDAEQYLTFQGRIESCEDYSEERRSQMRQHIDWLVDPATIPKEMLIALGTNPDGGLVFGMASYTSIQWRLLERPAESCLIDIGHDLNVLLEAVGLEPLTIYDE